MDETAYPTCGGPESGFFFEFKPEGVFLTVYPLDEEPLFEISDLTQVLSEAGINDFDLTLLMQTAQNAAGKPAKVTGPINLQEIMDHLGIEAGDESAPAKVINPQTAAEDEPYAKITLDVARDRQQVTIKFDTSQGSRLPTAEMVLAAMADKGIIYGIDRAAVDEGVKALDPFVAAKGDPPIPGENAYIERRYDLGEKGVPVTDEYDKADYK